MFNTCGASRVGMRSRLETACCFASMAVNVNAMLARVRFQELYGFLLPDAPVGTSTSPSRMNLLLIFSPSSNLASSDTIVYGTLYQAWPVKREEMRLSKYRT